MSARAALRRQCREARAALGAAARERASLAIVRHLCASAPFRAATRIALYWPIGDEADVRAVQASAEAAGKHCYLPLVRPDRGLLFQRYDAGETLHANAFGIPEPRHDAGRAIAPESLDLVCVPLIGFDRTGTRLGQGGGYYDRCFAFTRAARVAKPLLLGIAFACQELPRIAREDWDVPLAAIVTEHGLIDCRGIVR